MNEIIRVLVVLFLALSMTNCAQRNVERNYATDFPRKPPAWKSPKNLVREKQLSAEQDPENQNLK